MQPDFDVFSLFFSPPLFSARSPMAAVASFLQLGPQLCYDPCCPKDPSPGITLLIASLCPLWSGTCLWLLSSQQLARNRDTALFVQQLLLLFVWLSPWHAGQYLHSRSAWELMWWVADVWNPVAGAGRNIQQSSAASSTAMPECRDLATVMTQEPKQSRQLGGQGLVLSS